MPLPLCGLEAEHLSTVHILRRRRASWFAGAHGSCPLHLLRPPVNAEEALIIISAMVGTHRPEASSSFSWSTAQSSIRYRRCGQDASSSSKSPRRPHVGRWTVESAIDACVVLGYRCCHLSRTVNFICEAASPPRTWRKWGIIQIPGINAVPVR